MSVETTTIHITEAIRAAARYTAPPGYRGRHRHTNTDMRAIVGVAGLLLIGLPGTVLLGVLFAPGLAHLMGVR